MKKPFANLMVQWKEGLKKMPKSSAKEAYDQAKRAQMGHTLKKENKTVDQKS